MWLLTMMTPESPLIRFPKTNARRQPYRYRKKVTARTNDSVCPLKISWWCCRTTNSLPHNNVTKVTRGKTNDSCDGAITGTARPIFTYCPQRQNWKWSDYHRENNYARESAAGFQPDTTNRGKTCRRFTVRPQRPPQFGEWSNENQLNNGGNTNDRPLVPVTECRTWRSRPCLSLFSRPQKPLL